MSLQGQSRSSEGDSVWVSAKAARNLLIAAQQKPLLEEQVNILNQRIQAKESIISALQGKDSINAELTKSFQEEIRIMRDQRAVFEADLKSVNKQLRRARTKTKLVAFAGIITTVGAALLIK